MDRGWDTVHLCVSLNLQRQCSHCVITDVYLTYGKLYHFQHDLTWVIVSDTVLTRLFFSFTAASMLFLDTADWPFMLRLHLPALTCVFSLGFSSSKNLHVYSCYMSCSWPVYPAVWCDCFTRHSLWRLEAEIVWLFLTHHSPSVLSSWVQRVTLLLFYFSSYLHESQVITHTLFTHTYSPTHTTLERLAHKHTHKFGTFCVREIWELPTFMASHGFFIPASLCPVGLIHQAKAALSPFLMLGQ